MNKKFIDWLIFTLLSLIWGSSFILMKLGMQQLSSCQVAALRIFSAGLVLLPITIKYIKSVPSNKLFLIFLSGSIGNLIPAFLFCIAEEKIDSGLAGTLNSLTPIFVVVTGYIFFNSQTSINKIIGIFIAFTGSFLLLFSTSHL
ncbi:MAG: DMT family transporter, partial [Ferruginibacter sp.]|nr:DMT family transporter [Ferruginibacter sp.]